MNIVNELIELANNSGADGFKKYYHVNSLMGAGRYVSDAEHIKKTLGSNKAVLDLGCGHGQMSYIMKRLGLDVTAVDLMAQTPYFVSCYNKTFNGSQIQYYSSNILEEKQPSFLNRGKFDAICISGVLEHTSNFSLFLTKLRPLLVSKGKLFVFRFPNRYSWIEKINDLRFGNTIDHPLRFSPQEVHLMMRWHGFKIDRLDYEEIFPVNLQNFPRPLVRIYHALNPILIPLSKFICKIPILNKLSTSFRFICTKAYDY